MAGSDKPRMPTSMWLRNEKNALWKYVSCKKEKNREKPIKIVFLVSIRASSLPFTAVEAVAHSTKFGKKK